MRFLKVSLIFFLVLITQLQLQSQTDSLARVNQELLDNIKSCSNDLIEVTKASARKDAEINDLIKEKGHLEKENRELTIARDKAQAELVKIQNDKNSDKSNYKTCKDDLKKKNDKLNEVAEKVSVLEAAKRSLEADKQSLEVAKGAEETKNKALEAAKKTLEEQVLNLTREKQILASDLEKKQKELEQEKSSNKKLKDLADQYNRDISTTLDTLIPNGDPLDEHILGKIDKIDKMIALLQDINLLNVMPEKIEKFNKLKAATEWLQQAMKIFEVAYNEQAVTRSKQNVAQIDVSINKKVKEAKEKTLLLLSWYCEASMNTYDYFHYFQGNNISSSDVQNFKNYNHRKLLVLYNAYPYIKKVVDQVKIGEVLLEMPLKQVTCP